LYPQDHGRRLTVVGSFDAMVKLRLSSAELEEWQRRASERGVSVSELIRAAMSEEPHVHREAHGARRRVLELVDEGVRPDPPRPPQTARPVYEFTPRTCPERITHNSLHVCPRCGADSA
jgi:hypothetical protein